jgi:uncharacterized phage-associated protein
VTESVTFPFNERKAQALIDYIVWKVPGVEREPLKLAALIFLADKEHLLKYGHPMLGGTWIATEAGPIHREACESWLRLDSPWLPHAYFRSWKRGVWA